MLQRRQSKIPVALKSTFFFCSVGAVGVAHVVKKTFNVFFLSWSTFGPSECDTWGAGDEARERRQTSTHPHTLSVVVAVVPSLHLPWQSNTIKNRFFLDKEA